MSERGSEQGTAGDLAPEKEPGRKAGEEFHCALGRGGHEQVKLVNVLEQLPLSCWEQAKPCNKRPREHSCGESGLSLKGFDFFSVS